MPQVPAIACFAQDVVLVDDVACVAQSLFSHIKTGLMLWIETGVVMDIDQIIGLDKQYHDFMVQYFARDLFIKEFGFAVPRPDFVAQMRQFGPIVEVGAGRGLLSALLRANGLDIITTDANPFHSGYGWSAKREWQVQELSAKMAVLAYPNRTVLCSWPCYDKSWAHEMVQEMVSGQKLCLIGEGHGGCTGDDGLFNTLNRDFDIITTKDQSNIIFSWSMINDFFEAYQKR